MGFEVELGGGSATANSFQTVAGANTYHADHGNPSEWSSASVADKQFGLIEATRYLETKYHGRWKGVRKTSTQRLAFPRVDVNLEEDSIADEIPVQLKDATSILALAVVNGDTLAVDETTPGEIESISQTAGSVSQTVRYAGARGTQKKYVLADRLVRPLLLSSFGGYVERG